MDETVFYCQVHGGTRKQLQYYIHLHDFTVDLLKENKQPLWERAEPNRTFFTELFCILTICN